MGDEILRIFSNGDGPETPFFKRKSSSHHRLHRHNKEQDRFLPIANVGRIMKKVIPGNGKISKDAKETVQECVSEFISFVTGEASDKCQSEKRKTVNGEDVLWAITTLGFGDYVEPLKYYLDKYREIECEKLNVPKKHTAEQRLFHGQQHDQLLQQQEHILDSYSPANVPSQTSFGLPEQAFSDQVDSVCHW